MLSFALQATARAPRIDAADVTALIAHLGETLFVQSILGVIGVPLSANHCSILLRSPAGDACDIEAASLEGDGARAAGLAYVSAGFFTHDHAFADPRLARTAGVLTLQSRDEVPSSDQRSLCYDSLSIDQRCSIAARLDDGTTVATNFYRCASRGRFTDGDIGAAHAIAPLLLAAVRKHCRLRALNGARDMTAVSMSARWAQLSTREREVAHLCIRGCSAKHIARTLGIAVTTVNTLKQRAYQKLGIRRQSELIAALCGTGVPPFGA